jgi:hypothetical protein
LVLEVISFFAPYVMILLFLYNESTPYACVTYGGRVVLFVDMGRDSILLYLPKG